MSDIRGALIQNYLEQQMETVTDSEEMPDAASLDTFKEKVKHWIDLDNTKKQHCAAALEIKSQQKELTKDILAFMGRYNIENLNTRDGKLRYNVAMVKAPLTQKVIKQKFLQVYDPQKTKEQISQEIFETGEKVEKVSLRRVKISG